MKRLLLGLLSAMVLGSVLVAQDVVPFRTLSGHISAVTSVAFSPDGKTLASGSDDWTVKLWDVATGTALRTLSGHRGRVSSVAFSLDGKTLASGSWDDTIKLWDVAMGKELRTLSGHTDWVHSVAFSPDGKTLASGSADNTIKLWDVATGRELHTLTGHRGSVQSLTFSPDGKFLVSGSLDKTVRLWDVATGKVFYLVPTSFTAWFWVPAFSADGKLYAAGGVHEKEVRVRYDLLGTDFSFPYVVGSHSNSIAALVFSPCARYLVSTSVDGMIKIWTVNPRGHLCTLSGHTDGVLSVAFSPDGKLLASGSRDKTIKLWDVQAILYPNQPPVASFTWEALTPEGTRLLVQPRTGDRIRFDTSASHDPDGRIVKYEWDWTSDGTYDFTTTNPVTEYRFPTAGFHQVTLRVTDDKGATATTTQTVGIGEKRPPVANFAFTPTSPTILDTVRFTDESKDPDGTVTSWKWEFGDGATSTDKNPSHRYAQKRTFTVKLTVTDNDGLIATTTKTLTVVNLPPEALFTFAPKDPYAGQEITFDASSSQDKDGKITKYVWDFTGDGKPDREGVEATWTFPQPGTYPVTLTVTDDDGATATAKDEIQVTLSPEPVEAKRVWAVVVGVSAHREPRWNLHYARKDAEAFHRWLIETARVPKDQIRLLLDSQATLTEVRAGLEWLRRRADENDLVIFFFAGHGYQATDLAPVDEKDGLDEYFILYDTKREAIEATALRDDEFGQFLDRVLSKHVLVVFDSCHAAGGEREVRGLPRGARPVGDTVDIWGDFNLEGKIVLAAAKEDQDSYERDELGHGVFTYFLLQGLRGKADANRDGKVTVQELFTYVSQEVPRYVRETLGKEQHPQMIGRGTPQVVLSKANQPPTASFTFSPEAPFPGKEIRFQDLSTDDGMITAWNWSFGDGTTSTAQHPTHVYAEPGTYTVTLTVTDDGGLTAATTKQLIIGPAGEVTAIELARNLVTISLGARHGVKVGDRFEVVQIHVITGGVVITEVRATIEVIQVLGPERAACRLVEVLFPVQIKDQVRPVRGRS